MADISLVVRVTRSALGLDDLDINDHVTYRIAPGSFGGQMTWRRSTAASPYMDDEITVHRTRAKVTEPVVIEVLGTSAVWLHRNAKALIDAFSQDYFELTVTVDGQTHKYACEAADFGVSWTGPRFKARQLQVTFQVPRAPNPLSGVF